MKKVVHLEYGGIPLCDIYKRRKTPRRHPPALTTDGLNETRAITCKACEKIYGRMDGSFWS